MCNMLGSQPMHLFTALSYHIGHVTIHIVQSQGIQMALHCICAHQLRIEFIFIILVPAHFQLGNESFCKQNAHTVDAHGYGYGYIPTATTANL